MVAKGDGTNDFQILITYDINRFGTTGRTLTWPGPAPSIGYGAEPAVFITFSNLMSLGLKAITRSCSSSDKYAIGPSSDGKDT